MSSPERRFFVQAGGVDIHWAEMGWGRPLVLLHGLSDSHRTWRRVVPLLARGRRVLMPDLPGHGLSGRPDASYALAWHASVLGAWIEALDLTGVDLVGHSFGGGVAQYLLLEHRARVRRLGLVAAGGLGAEVGIGLRLLSMPGLVERAGQPFMGPATRVAMRALGGAFADEEDIDWLGWANAMPGSARALGRTVRDVISWRGQRRHFLDRAGELRDLPPTALFWGERDPIIPVSHGAAFEELVEGAVLTRFAGCGHFPHRERPDDFALALAEFVEREHVAPASLRRTLVAVPAAPRTSRWRTLVSAVKQLFRRRPSRGRRASRATLPPALSTHD